MRVVSWNVNGLRAIWGKGLPAWLKQEQARGTAVIGLQETRVLPEQAPELIDAIKQQGWHVALSPAVKKGYAGVGLLSRVPPDSLQTTVGVEAIDCEGRLQLARFGELLVVNGYFPNGNGKERDNSRIPFKLDFYRRLFDVLEAERAAGGRILVMGDWNTAHTEIDLARPKANHKTSGFTPIEREELDRWLQTGWTDTFRHFDPSPERYSWWSSRFGVREKNIGWRIDLALASPGLLPFLQGAFIDAEVQGSDHAPIGVELRATATR
jgi:exodeoxyribonuclease III